MHAQVKQRENCTLDILKIAASILVAASHMPGLFTSELVELYYDEWFFRFCVPFFFGATGYFFYRSRNKGKNLKRMAWLFAFGYALYLPRILADAGDLATVFSRLRWNLVIGYEHLWYLSAVLTGMLVWYVLEKVPALSRLLWKLGIPVSIGLLLIGALLDEHYRMIDVPLLQKAGSMLAIFGGPRNVVFMGFPLMILGGAIARYEDRIRKIPICALVVLWVVLRALAFWECGYLHSGLGYQFNADMSFFGMWPGLILLELSFRVHVPMPERFARVLRKMSEYIYILHPLVMTEVNNCFRMTPIQIWLTSVIVCALLYIVLEKQFEVRKG